MIFCSIMSLIFFILSLFLFSGKGSWLVAGYNTLPEEEKLKYNSKKMCKAVGIVCLVCSILLLVMVHFIYKIELGIYGKNELLIFTFLFIGVLILTIIGVIIYINKKAKN